MINHAHVFLADLSGGLSGVVVEVTDRSILMAVGTIGLLRFFEGLQLGSINLSSGEVVREEGRNGSFFSN